MKSEEVIKSMEDYPFFVNQDNLLQSLQWEAVGGSSVVTQRSSDIEADFVFPVQITSNRLYVGPLGAYSGNVGTLEKAKYRMICAAPSDPTSNCKDTGPSLSPGDLDHRHSGYHQPGSIRKKGPVASYRYLEDFTTKKSTQSASSQATMDEETMSYPVPREFRERFDQVATDYEVRLLPVYFRKEFVPPEETSETLNGALAQLHLSVSHSHIKKPEESLSFDAFNGNIRQVVVHSLGPAKPVSPYKRKNVRDGPVGPPPRSAATKGKGKHVVSSSDDD
ncbi:hypothetical protein JB92DRAFT_3120013 [Gautieria morchelliformis]|nr:hypothetical protein JB92DRAFT_3120013 [Gautieria morchelliformis]